MADHGEPGRDPEFGVRVLGYSRAEVDEFVAEVRRELRCLNADPEEPGPSEGYISRLLRFAQEEADARVAEARYQAEQTLRSAREVADRLMADARMRAVELEARVAGALDREVAARVAELTHTHARLVTGMTGLRDSLADALDRDAQLGPPPPLSLASLVEQRVQGLVPRPGGRSDERARWGTE